MPRPSDIDLEAWHGTLGDMRAQGFEQPLLFVIAGQDAVGVWEGSP